MYIKKQSELSDPLEFLNMNTGYTQVKYQILKQWPIVSADLANTQDLIKVKINIDVEKSGALSGLEDATENIQVQK